MLGAIAGDIIGSLHEGSRPQPGDFTLFPEGCRFTDDTVCTIAVADAAMTDQDFAGHLRTYVQRHPRRRYGKMFRNWACSKGGPYGSFGNGGAMRVSSLPYLASNLEDALDLAARSAAVSHDHPSAMNGATAVVFGIWRALEGAGSDTLRSEIASRYGYSLAGSIDELRQNPPPGVSTESSVPAAIACACLADDYEQTVRLAVSLGGDTDTVACIAGGIAEARFGVPEEISGVALGYLTPDLLETLERFEKHGGQKP